MRLLTFLFTALLALAVHSVAAPDPRAKALDWLSKDIQTEIIGDQIQITLHTQGMAGKRIILTEVQRFPGQTEVALTWQVVQNFEESFRHFEHFDVKWSLPKDEFERLKTERKFYILMRDEVILRRDAIQEIKTSWQIH